MIFCKKKTTLTEEVFVSKTILLVVVCSLASLFIGFAVGNRYFIKKTIDDLLDSISETFKSSKTETDKIVLTGNENTKALIEELQIRFLTTRKGVVIGSLLVLRWIADQRDAGRKVIAVEDDGESPWII